MLTSIGVAKRNNPLQNAELTAVRTILGLKHGDAGAPAADILKNLRYGKVMLMVRISFRFANCVCREIAHYCPVDRSRSGRFAHQGPFHQLLAHVLAGFARVQQFSRRICNAIGQSNVGQTKSRVFQRR